MILEQQSLELLEFDQIRKKISVFAKTEGGKELIFSQDFDSDRKTLNYKKDLVSDWKTMLASDLKKPDYFFPDIRFLKRLQKSGTVLEGIELADAAEFIKSSSIMKSFCLQEADNLVLTGCLKSEAESIPDISKTANRILKEINPDGTVKENHPLLKNARSRIAGLHKKITGIASSFLNENREIWQSAVPAQRDGRTVLPLKTNFRGRIDGLVQEVSSSGATVFIEPYNLVQLNNDMTYEQSQLNQQIHKIYSNVTAMLRDEVEKFEQLLMQAAYIDSFQARALFSIQNKCIRPEESDSGIIIRRGRHPLLGDSAVPISLNYSDHITVLIITGPNAGGKTVTLKTCGLFVLMNQFACELPCEEGTAIGLFKKVFADIGDDQSIEESLSTFSGHMKRISSIVKRSGPESLVLLDELGSGTDPSQGSAIAMGVLDFFLQKNIATIITTHHAAVKNFGYTHKNAVNASVAFDSVTLKPTYEILEGVPGESHALEIAQSCGLGSWIIDKAEQYYDGGDATVSEMINELERRQTELFERRSRLEKAEDALKADRQKFDLLNLKVKQAENRLKTADYSELKEYISESKKLLENLVRELREEEITKEKTQRVKEFISKMDDKLIDSRKKISKNENEIKKLEKKPEQNKSIRFRTGMTVKYIKNNKQGILIEERKNDQWIVAFGNVKLNIAKEDLLFLEEGSKNKKGVDFTSASAGASPVFEIDLRGMRVYEAENALIKQIDTALISGTLEFSVIHGLGEGILQKSVHDFLSSCASVSDFSFSSPEEGGYGKTIVRLKNGI